jgi:hypothetical protein
MLKIPHCQDSRLTDGGKVVSPKHPPHSTPQKHFSVSGTRFCLRLSKPQGLVRSEGLGKLKKKKKKKSFTSSRLTTKKKKRAGKTSILKSARLCA